MDDGELRLHDQASIQDKTHGQPQVTKIIWEQISHTAGLLNRSERANNVRVDVREHVEGIAVTGGAG